jgi:hypothetical protein
MMMPTSFAMKCSLFVALSVTARALTTLKSPLIFPRKPVLLLDVDGVINLLDVNCRGKSKSCGWTDTVETEVRGFDIQYSPTVIKKINEWNAIAEVRWLTTWDSKAQSMLAPALGLDEFPLGRIEETYTGKTAAAINTAEEVGSDGLVIWIDDDLKKWKEGNDGEEMSDRQIIFSRLNTVLLSPRYGLTPDQIKFIDDILADPALTKGKCVVNLEPGERIFSF